MNQSYCNQTNLQKVQTPCKRVKERGQSQNKKNSNSMKTILHIKNSYPRWIENTNASK